MQRSSRARSHDPQKSHTWIGRSVYGWRKDYRAYVQGVVVRVQEWDGVVEPQILYEDEEQLWSGKWHFERPDGTIDLCGPPSSGESVPASPSSVCYAAIDNAAINRLLEQRLTGSGLAERLTGHSGLLIDVHRSAGMDDALVAQFEHICNQARLYSRSQRHRWLSPSLRPAWRLLLVRSGACVRAGILFRVVEIDGTFSWTNSSEVRSINPSLPPREQFHAERLLVLDVLLLAVDPEWQYVRGRQSGGYGRLMNEACTVMVEHLGRTSGAREVCKLARSTREAVGWYCHRRHEFVSGEENAQRLVTALVKWENSPCQFAPNELTVVRWSKELPSSLPAAARPVPAPAATRPVPAPAVACPMPAPAVARPVPAPAVACPMPAPSVAHLTPAPAAVCSMPAAVSSAAARTASEEAELAVPCQSTSPPKVGRTCGTPGCRKPDFHPGPCDSWSAARTRTSQHSRRSGRLCGTPGCRQPDHHRGPCIGWTTKGSRERGRHTLRFDDVEYAHAGHHGLQDWAQCMRCHTWIILQSNERVPDEKEVWWCRTCLQKVPKAL